MPELSPFLSKPSAWVEQVAELNAEIKKLEDRKDGLTSKLKLHMKEQNLEAVQGEKHEFKRSTSERTDLSQKAIAATFGDKYLDELIVKLPKVKSESFRIVELKPEDPKVREIVDHFIPPPVAAPAIPAAKPKAVETPKSGDRLKKLFSRK